MYRKEGDMDAIWIALIVVAAVLAVSQIVCFSIALHQRFSGYHGPIFYPIFCALAEMVCMYIEHDWRWKTHTPRMSPPSSASGAGGAMHSNMH